MAGWIDLKKKHGIVYRQISGESESVSENDVSEWQNVVLSNLISRYEPRDIFNADECGLFFKLMPDKSYVFNGEKCHGGKLSKERVTVLVAANSDGSEKLPLVVIGKSAKPRCFKNVQNLPCVYKNQTRAWMTGDLFITWLKDLDNKMTKAGRKILLFVDNCPSHHNNVNLKNVELAFLPPCTTSRLQPMDQGIIKVLKHFYRKQIVLRYLQEIDSGEKKPVTLLDAVNYVSVAWEGVNRHTIANCFRKAGFNKDSENAISEVTPSFPISEVSNDDEDWAAVRNKLGDVHLDDFVCIDNDIVTSEIRDVDEIIGDYITVEEEEDESVVEPVPTRREALSAMKVLRQFTSASDGIPVDVNSYLNRIENVIIHCSGTRTRQTTLNDFFRKKL